MSQYHKNIDIEVRRMDELKAVLETRLNPPVPIGESPPDEPEFRRGHRKRRFRETNSRSRELNAEKNWEARIKPEGRPQGPDKSTIGASSTISTASIIVKPFIETPLGCRGDGCSKQVARLFEKPLHLREDCRPGAGVSYEANTAPKYVWPAVRTCGRQKHARSHATKVFDGIYDGDSCECAGGRHNLG